MTHRLIVDRKITTWVRTEVDVQADTLENAVYKYMNPAMPDCDFISSHEIEGLRMPTSVKENNHTATIEIFTPDKNGAIYDNLTNNFNDQTTNAKMETSTHFA